DGGPMIFRPLTFASRKHGGEEIQFPARKFSSVEIQIAGTVRNKVAKVATEKGRRRKTGVGFAEVKLVDNVANALPVRATEVERLPQDLMRALGTRSAAHPLAIIMTPTFADFRRKFELPTPRAFSLSGEVRLNAQGRDDALDRALGIPLSGEGGITVTSTERLGNVAARSSAAFDGNPKTAWNSRSRDLVGEGITVQVPNPVTFDHLNLQVVADGRHSTPTRLRIVSNYGSSRVVDIAAGAVTDGVRSVTPRFEPITGDRFTITLDAVALLQVRGSNGAPITLPIAIAEMGIPGVQRAAMPAQMPTRCVEQQLRIDGTPFPVRVTGTTADAEQGRALTFAPCDLVSTLALDAGTHQLDASTTRRDGLAFGRMLLTSAANGAAAPVSTYAPPAAERAVAARVPQIRVAHRGRTSMQIRASGGRDPFWMVLGQSFNRGWHATADGRDLGEAQLVDGFANGWRVSPHRDGSPVTITLEWTPQQYVKGALIASGLGVLACLGIIIGAARRRRRRTVADDDDVHSARDNALAVGGEATPARAEASFASFRSRAVPASWGSAVVAAGALGFGTAVLTRTSLGALVALGVLGVLRWPRARIALRLLPAVVMVLIGFYVAWGQFRHNYTANFEWPTYFEPVRNVSWLVVILLAADVVVGRVLKADDHPSG
ncbi:MAG: hypothetical protein ABIP21_06795, partial [Acidimicrobiia bacterium]